MLRHLQWSRLHIAERGLRLYDRKGVQSHAAGGLKGAWQHSSAALWRLSCPAVSVLVCLEQQPLRTVDNRNTPF